MAELVSALVSCSQISYLPADIYYVGLKDLSWRCPTYFDYEEIAKLNHTLQQQNKKLWLALNLAYEESDLAQLKDAVLWCKEHNITGILYSSLAVYQVAQTLKYPGALIYSADTLITNRYDAAFYGQRNQTIILSPAITLAEIVEIAKSNPGKCALKVFGHISLALSKRKFLSSYFEYIEDTYCRQESYSIQETTRTGKMPLLQETRGSSIYSAAVLESLAELKILAEYCSYLIIDPLFISREVQEQVIEIYRCYLLGEIDLNQAQEKLPLVANKAYYNGFYYKKTSKAKIEVGDE